MLAGLTAQCLAAAIDQPPCSSEAISSSAIPGIQITQLVASPVNGYTTQAPSLNATLNFYNVTVTYTHPGWNDSINVYLWLPDSKWNSRLQGIGGGGFFGLQNFYGLETAIFNNYSAVGTDTGQIMNSETASSWALDSSGRVNLGLLEDFAAVALNDAALIANSIIQSYFGTAPNKPYWNGCSTGGRQGLKMAQRYPQTYDGIVANAPAINWARFIVAEYWPQFTMNQLQSYPPQCVFNYITNATIAACDKIDGLVDGIISAPGLCTFDPHILIGQTVERGDYTTNITDNDATIGARTWQGPVTSTNESMWYGLLPGAPFIGLANTTCTRTNCTGNPFPIPPSWIDYFVLQMPDFDISSINQSTYEIIYALSVSFYENIMSTNNPDLFEFKSAGGKMITWHGLADQLIHPMVLFNITIGLKHKIQM